MDFIELELNKNVPISSEAKDEHLRRQYAEEQAPNVSRYREGEEAM